jgi:uncharacterized protein
MSERDGFQPGVPSWVDTLQPDPEAARRFYGGLFDWEFAGPGPMPSPGGGYFVARLRGREVAGVGSQPAPDTSPAWNTYIEVASADEAAQRVGDAGGAVVVDPVDVLPAGRMAVLSDPEGAVFGIWEPKDRKGAQIVNEPSAWSMSALNTRDVEGAKRFYRELLGWTTEVFTAGDNEIVMFCLPSYVGGQPEQPVPRDVVATMVQLGPDRSDVPAHWGVDFWVGDADATVTKAAELGGAVLSPAVDFPGLPMRSGVVADPAGASFSVTELKVAELGAAEG